MIVLARIKQAVLLAIAGFLAVGWLDPAALSGLAARADDGMGWKILAILASGASMTAAVPLPMFGPDVSVHVPAFLAMATPWFLRFMAWRVLRQSIGLVFSGRRREVVSQWTPAARSAPDEPDAIPSNVEAAIAAALRARARAQS